MANKRRWERGLIIEGKLPSLNETIQASKRHWSKYAAMKKEWTEIVAWEAKKMMKIRTKRNLFTLCWHMKNKRTDPDNISFAKKFILDGLVVAQIIPKDNWKYVGGFIDIFEITKLKQRVCIYISPLEEKKELTFDEKLDYMRKINRDCEGLDKYKQV